MDRILTFNVGSSSLKWTLFDERDARVDGATVDLDSDAVDEVAARVGDVDGVAHRIVHGADRFRGPTLVDDAVLRDLTSLVELDRLHMRPALSVLRAAYARFRRAPHFAVFDTTFHRTLPPEASTYAVPRVWREQLGVRRYGFHGLSVEYACERIAQIVDRRLERVLVLHLGSGASATAVRDGRSVDTTMGMTPLEGIVMGTRSGSIDPGALLHLMSSGVSLTELEDGLERASGLFALSGSSDMRELARRAQKGDAVARSTRLHFVHSVAKHAASMLPALGSVDAIVFTGGIGEGDSEIRELVARRLAFVGVQLDDTKNREYVNEDLIVSTASSRVAVGVVHAREDIMLLRAARQTSCNEETHHGTAEANSRRH